ncbi:hypothetical protein LCGC14_2495120, partial [marine sediment metagenome]
MRSVKLSVCVVAATVLWAGLSFADGAGVVTGELKRWHRVTVTFTGPKTAEDASPNPFADYRLMVTFTHGKTSVVVGG